MQSKKEIIIRILISVCILIGVHLFAFMLQTNNASFRAFRAWQKNDWKSAQTLREKSFNDNPNDAYNLGTLLAQQSVVSGEVFDRNTLQRAEGVLSGASVFTFPKKNELIHNLETVRALLAQSGSGQQDQQQQSGNSGDNQQQQQNSGSGDQNQEEQQQSGAGEPLSESMKQQLEQYQQQLQQEQAQNQQFYGKEQSGNPSGDPFDILNQFFGGPPQLQQQVGNDGKPDW